MTTHEPKVTDEGRVIVQGVCVEKAIQVRHTRQWITVNRSGEKTLPGSWPYLAQAVDALRAHHGVGVPNSPARVLGA